MVQVPYSKASKAGGTRFKVVAPHKVAYLEGAGFIPKQKQIFSTPNVKSDFVP